MSYRIVYGGQTYPVTDESVAELRTLLEQGLTQPVLFTWVKPNGTTFETLVSGSVALTITQTPPSAGKVF